MSVEQVMTNELPNNKCLIPGCEHQTLGKLCHEHWFKLPMKLRARWWSETDYGKKNPAPELVEEIRQTVKQQQAEQVADESAVDQ